MQLAPRRGMAMRVRRLGATPMIHITPEQVRRILGRWETTPVVYNPDTASWCAPCPHCNAEADWWSGMTTSGLQYRMHCTLCGPVEWVAAS